VVFKHNPHALENSLLKIILVVKILADPELTMLALILRNFEDFAV
jgi:hypothetical protein